MGRQPIDDPAAPDPAAPDPAALPSAAVVTVFRSRLRPGVEQEYVPLAQRMETLARSMPGFVDFKTFTAADGERVSVVVFTDADAHNAWRDHPEHREAQRAGRERLYARYHIAVCTLTGEHRFHGPES
ncbi:MAG: antibiotic biosynthesis monooxygenase family protein [Acidimicrobiales bacterium]